MEEDELRAARREILGDLSAILREHLALAEWGRVLIELAPRPDGELAVADVTVDEVFGDEAAVDQAFASEAARQLVPGFAQIVLTLLAIDQVEVGRVGGGTFVRVAGTEPLEVEFLPGLIRAPSPAFEAQRASVEQALAPLEAASRAALGLDAGARLATDMVLGTFESRHGEAVVASGQQVVLGSFSGPHRSWVWGAHNPSLAPEARARAAALLDQAPARAAWELSTPGFATDAATAWTLAGWLATGAALAGIVRVRSGDGFVVLGLPAIDRA